LTPTQNPAKLFLACHGPVESLEDVKEYARFLRKESGLDSELPIDLVSIFQHFGLPLPNYVPSLPVQGLLVDSQQGLMLINADDPQTRRRFSEAHELMEILFNVDSANVRTGSRVAGFKHYTKEKLCNVGAAELLMPQELILPKVEEHGISFAVARALAVEYHVSMTAALVRMAELTGPQYFVVLWRMKNKPKELRNVVPAEQFSMFPELRPAPPPKKLRVEWTLGNGDFFVPQDKSVPDDSVIHTAWERNQFTSGRETLDLGTIQGTFDCENQPFDEQDGERFVLSLLHFRDYEAGVTHTLVW
jgi:hypothetical protein